MNKQKLFLDFDSTITNSIKAVCDSYNILYQDHQGFIPAKWMYVEKWNFTDQCPLIENVHDVFEHDLFFKHLEFIDFRTEDVIKQLCEKYEVIVATLGTPLNIAKKVIWLRDNLPCIKEYVLLVNDRVKMDKSVVNMSGAIFIDDHADNLDSSNAGHKIIFGDFYDWNRDSEYTRCINWIDVERLLI